ncbi:MAG: metallophosphoesterase family protein [Myxococcaceae bacterium]
MRFKFVHAADLHLDSPLKGLGQGEACATVVQTATFTALSRIVGLCLRERVDFLVLSGDLFDTRDRSVRARLQLRKELSRLDEAKIQTFIVHGNHDPLLDTDSPVSLPPSVKVFGTAVEECEVRRDGRLLCRVQGISYPQERVTDNLTQHFTRSGEEFTVGVLHANVGDISQHANYSPCTLQDLAERGLNYWALGHVHTRSEHRLESGGLAVYPGNPQGRHVNETGERGCVLVDVTEGVVVTRFYAIDSVRWHRISLDTTELLSLEALAVAAEEQIATVCTPGLDAHAVRLTLEGRTTLRAELTQAGVLQQLEESLRESLAARTPPVLLESLRDATQPDLDIGALVAAGGLTGTLATDVQRAGESRLLLEELWGEEDLKKLDTALQRLSLPKMRELAPALVRQAGLRALELLLDGEG